jgi:hypothetical protein
VELYPLKKYANMFGSYKAQTVWSAPEVLKSKKKLLEPNAKMDVYSFGLLIWEMFHEQVPFSNDLQACTKFICEESRPRIDSPEDEDEDEDATKVTRPIASIIRRCWVSEPSERPSMN